MLRVSKDCVVPSSSVILPSIAGGLSWCELAVVMRAGHAPCDSQLREIYAGDRRFIRGANRKESDWLGSSLAAALDQWSHFRCG